MWRTSALAAVLVSWTSLALAATEEPHGESVGMPQLDPTFYVSQIFWLVVLFAILYWLMSSRGAPRIAEILESRQDRIAVDLDRAQALRGEAETAMRQHEAMLADANAKARAEITAAQAKGAAEAERREREVEASLAHQLGEAERRIQDARTRALDEIEVVAAEVSRAASGRLLGIEVPAEDAARAVEAVRQGAR